MTTSPTPRMTPHARERCVEMGISTKVAKQIVSHAETTYPGTASRGDSTTVHLWSGHPGYAVVTVDRGAGEGIWVLTVLFNAQDFAERCGTNYLAREA